MKPLVIAHRGWSARYPENTLAAIRAAIRLGVDMVEIDVQQTRDDELVVFHDYRLDRIYGVHKRVCDALRKELPDAPTLVEVLRLKFPLLIEIKGADPGKVVQLIKQSGMSKRVIVFSIHPGKVRRCTGVPCFGLSAGRSSFILHPSSFSVSGWGVSRRLIRSRRDVQRLHRRGWKVFVWTVNQPAEMRRLAAWGVDGLITDHPDRTLNLEL